ncbi:hypothetical protein UA08_00111 [Talaromyces atroroseus]|uniref:Uncharacterized protein n=1 Tax=Talaromyces atroroseus TaxID=1441469 RepID=A0A225AUJ0_TALAT|nr:hypothetical protein UA08_00111 [Talaromyces atroroseus]OKL64600.1 hypothetical protein UA08_00111 [Talaromyces atroroseus]
MSLKRKASFSRESFHDRAMEDVPRHLNSRTRKRFRDARPDEQTVYANTLRILYQAQKEPIVSNPPDESTPPPSKPEAPDPRQQTLLKFFQPAPAPSSLAPVNMQCHSTNNNIRHVARPVIMEFETNQSTTSASGSSTPVSTGITEMDINMDTDINMDYAAQGRWVMA